LLREGRKARGVFLVLLTSGARRKKGSGEETMRGRHGFQQVDKMMLEIEDFKPTSAFYIWQ
jgi:hypothetical protein